MSEDRELDLGAYFRRIGVRPADVPDLALLRALHSAHLSAIPFENIDVYLGRGVALDLPSLEKKFLHNRRGGYCFEQNTLFAAVLRGLGYEVQTLEARVRPPGATAPLARTHMLLRVDIDGRSWLADVGFGGDGPLYPVPLDGSVEQQADMQFCVARETFDVYVLRSRANGDWQDLYAFTLMPALPIDFELANYYTSTHPRSSFVKTLTAQLTTHEARHVLRGRRYSVRRGEENQVIDLDDAEVMHILSEIFGLDVPELEPILKSRSASP